MGNSKSKSQFVCAACNRAVYLNEKQEWKHAAGSKKLPFTHEPEPMERLAWLEKIRREFLEGLGKNA